MPRKSTHKDSLAHQRIDDHEKLCLIMQRETNKKIKDLHEDIHRLERIMISSSAFIITTLIGIVVALILKLN